MSGYIGKAKAVNFAKVDLPIRDGNTNIIEQDGSYYLKEGASIKDQNGNTIIASDGTIAGVDFTPIETQLDSIEQDITSLDTSIGLLEDSVENITYPAGGEIVIGGNVLASHTGVEGAGSLTLGNTVAPASSYMFRNKIINGDMRIDQRNAGSSVALNSTAYTLDRWNIHASGLDEAGLNISRYSMTTSDLNSTGFANALKVEVGTAESAIAADEYVSIQQRIEAQNLTDLKFGTANAKSLMLSFWVKTSLAGTYGITIEKIDTTARIINKSFTTTTTDWEEVKIPIAGDTNSGALIVDDVGEGFRLSFWLGAGSDYTTSSSSSWINYSDPYWAGSHQQNAFLTTQNATFYITGVQLEEGPVATPFEQRPYGLELSLCQRYFYASPESHTSAAGLRLLGDTAYMLPTQMRVSPTILVYGVGGRNSTSGYYDKDYVGNVAASGYATRDVLYVTNDGGVGWIAVSLNAEL